MLLLLLFIIPVIAIALTILVRQRYLLETIAIISSIAECIIVGCIIPLVIAHQAYDFSFYFSVNALSGLILCIITLAGSVATFHAVGYLRTEQNKQMIGFRRIKECYLLMRLFLLCMYLAITATNPIVMWIATEATTLSTVFLISFFNRKADIEAAWKYLIINSVGLLLGLLGTLLFLTQGPNTLEYVTWADLLSHAHTMNIFVVKFAFIFVLIGYGTKMGLVPMHTWKPDTYNKAPLPVVALLSGALLNVAFLAILHFKVIIDAAIGTGFSQMLFIFFGIISLVVPAVIIYSQVNFKRMLAYSTIEHAGIMLLGFGFGGIGIFGALLHMMYHALGKTLLFLLSSNIAVKYSSSNIENVKGMIKTLPYTSVLYLLGFLVIVGLPPFGIFFSEFYIILAGFSHYMILTIIALLGLLIVFAGFFRHVFSMLFGKPSEDTQPGEVSAWMTIPVTVLSIILISLSIYLPNGLQTLLKVSTEMFMH